MLYLDTNIFIFLLEGKPDESQRIKLLFDTLKARPNAAVTSELTLAEVLAGSQHPKDSVTKRSYLDLIVWSNFVKLIPISRGVLYETAELRNAHKAASQRKLDLADAIHLVTAVHERCRYFVSEDRGIVPPSGMT